MYVNTAVHLISLKIRTESCNLNFVRINDIVTAVKILSATKGKAEKTLNWTLIVLMSKTELSLSQLNI